MWRCKAVLVIGCEIDPVRVAAAICWREALEGTIPPSVQVDFRVGRAEQLLPQLRRELGPESVDILILAGNQGSKIGLDRVKESFGPTGEPQDHLQMSMEDIWSDGRVDLTLRTREPTSRLERLQQRVLRQVDQWCAEYEGKIRALGGIGFFMGLLDLPFGFRGIGPDGHVAFNCQGCDHFSTTRLDELNYPSQAAAAGDLGGIEAVRKRKVITIGLGTVTFNPRCVALICAAGEAKAQLPRACFFLTSGAAKLLSRRQLALLETLKDWTPTRFAAIDDQLVEKALVSLCCQRRKRLLDLTATDLSASPFAAEVLRKAGKPLKDCAEQVRKTLIQTPGVFRSHGTGCQVREKCQFLHTEPHHDDS
eukprot:g6780.t1